MNLYWKLTFLFNATMLLGGIGSFFFIGTIWWGVLQGVWLVSFILWIIFFIKAIVFNKDL